jgi:hypothetical protein
MPAGLHTMVQFSSDSNSTGQKHDPNLPAGSLAERQQQQQLQFTKFLTPNLNILDSEDMSSDQHITVKNLAPQNGLIDWRERELLLLLLDSSI